MKNGKHINKHGHQYWYLNDLLHRIDEPSIKFNDGGEIWCQYGSYHRLDGPAIIRSRGDQLIILRVILYSYQRLVNRT